MRFTHLGHACLLVETDSTRVLIDPGTFSRFEDVSDLDAIVVTHQHADHLDVDRLDALVAASPDAQLWADPGSAQQIQQLDVSVRTTVPGDTFVVGEIAIEPVGALHAENHPRVPQVPNVGLVLEADGVRFLHPGDALDAEPEQVDYLAVPLNAPWCAVRDTIDFVRRLAPRSGIVPIHDALLAPAGRAMYLKHVGDFGRDGGVPVIDGADGQAHELPSIHAR